MSSERYQLDLVGEFYDSAAEPGRWSSTWRRLIDSFGGSSGSLLVQEAGQAPTVLAMPGFSETALRLYTEHFHSADLWAEAGRNKVGLRAVNGEELVSIADFVRSEVWNDFSRPHVGAFHLLGSAFSLGRGRVAIVGIHRQRDAAAFGEAEAGQLQRLLPHLQRALDLGDRLAEDRRGPALAIAALEGLAKGVLVCLAHGEIVFANGAVEDIARRDGRLRLGARLTGGLETPARESHRLKALIHDAATGGSGGALHLQTGGGRPPLALMISPLPSAIGGFPPGTAGGAALVLVEELGGKGPRWAAALQELYGLTTAETELAAGLVAGGTPEAIAAERQVRLSTIRSQLHALYAKTGCGGQVDLVRLLARLPRARDDGA